MDETSLIKLEVTDDGSTEFGTYWKAVMSNFRKLDAYGTTINNAIETAIATAKAYTDNAIAGALEATY
jgi:hypothetical protein